MPMNTSLVNPPRRALDRPTAWGCATTNQLVLPGLGSLIAGRKSGYAQAALALGGLVLTGLFAIWLFAAWVRLHNNGKEEIPLEQLLRDGLPYCKVGGLGVALFLTGWLWALASS